MHGRTLMRDVETLENANLIAREGKKISQSGSDRALFADMRISN
jgi:hypothetical protein